MNVIGPCIGLIESLTGPFWDKLFPPKPVPVRVLVQSSADLLAVGPKGMTYTEVKRGPFVYTEEEGYRHIRVDGFKEWCELRGVSLVLFGESSITKHYKVELDSEDLAFEFKMRWL